MHNVVSQKDLAPSIGSPPCAGFFVSATSFTPVTQGVERPYSFHSRPKPAVRWLSFSHQKTSRAVFEFSDKNQCHPSYFWHSESLFSNAKNKEHYMRRPPPQSPVETSYELVRRRIQRLISAPHAQKIQSVVVTRSEEESADAWLQVLQEIEETNGIRVDRLETGVVRIGWREYCEA